MFGCAKSGRSAPFLSVKPSRDSADLTFRLIKETNLMTLSTRSIMVLALLVGLSTALVNALGGTTQEEHERTVEKQSFGNEPVNIKAIRTKKKNVLKDIVAGKKFASADDWLKGLTVNVENKSDKNINYVSVLIVYSRG